MADIFGLPAHPLLVHAVVVLIPLAAVAVTAMVVVPRTRRYLVWPTLALAVTAAVLTPLAAESGESLADRVDETAALEQHEGLGEAMTPFAVGLAIGAAALALEDVAKRRAEPGPALAWTHTRAARIGLASIALVSAVAATAQTVAVGHSGAEATWQKAAADAPASAASQPD